MGGRTRPQEGGVWVFVAAASALLAALLALAPRAAAQDETGVYIVHSCKTPDGGEAGLPWTITSRISSGYINKDNCPKGSYDLGLSPSVTHPANDYQRAMFTAPNGTEIYAYSIWRSVQTGQQYNLWFSEHDPEDNETLIETCFGGDGCRSKGDPDEPFARANLVHREGLKDVTGLEILLTCGLSDDSTSSCGAVSPGVQYQIHRADVALRDLYAPVFALPPNGPLVDSRGPLAGPQQVFIWASDRGGGVYQVVFRVDGEEVARVPIDPNDAECQAPFRVTRPCPSEIRTAATLDTSLLPDGRHKLRIRVTDATGSNHAQWGPVTIRTANGACAPKPRVKDMRLRARLTKKWRKRDKIPYRARPKVRGRLVDSAGNPVPNAEICVGARQDRPGAKVRQAATITTNERGRFSYKLRSGPSRKVYFVHRVGAGAASDRVKVDVSAPVRLKAKPKTLRNGDTVKFRGKLRGPIPGRGVLVEMQAKRGSSWQTFATTRSNRKGKFRSKYTFTRTTGVQRYKLRARVPTQAAYPYAAGSSRPVKVKVVG